MNPLLQSVAGTIFLHSYFLWSNVITLIQIEAVFWSIEIVFFNESFILASGNGFRLITNLLLLFRAFPASGHHLEIKCRPIFFQKNKKKNILARWNYFLGFLQIFLGVGRQHFSLSWNGVFIKFFITTSVYRFWVNFKPCVFIQNFSSCCWKTLLKLVVN